MDGDYNNKFTGGFILIALSVIIIYLALSLVGPDGICLAALFGLLLFAIGMLLILSGGTESINEWRSGNKKPNLLIVGIIAFLFVATTILQMLIPEIREGIVHDIILAIMASLFCILLIYSIKSKQR